MTENTFATAMSKLTTFFLFVGGLCAIGIAKWNIYKTMTAPVRGDVSMPLQYLPLQVCTGFLILGCALIAAGCCLYFINRYALGECSECGGITYRRRRR